MAGQVWLDTNLVRFRQIFRGTDGQFTNEGTGNRRTLQLLKSWGYLLLLIGSLAGSLSLPAHSQEFSEPPDAPSFNKKLFIAEVSAYTAVNVLDGITTAQSIRKGYIEGGFPQGSSYLMGQRPSVARYVVTMGLIETGVSIAAYRLQHSKTKWKRMAGHGLMMQMAYTHTDGLIRNIRLMGSP
jgi:hypothetical protein